MALCILAFGWPQSVLGDDLETLRGETDILWLVVASALVFFMQAGFALLESGMSRTKNSVNVAM